MKQKILSPIKKVKEKVFSKLKNNSSKVGLDLPYFFAGGSWLATGQFFTMLKFFILSLGFANLISKELYGQYSFVMSMLGFATIFALPGMSNAIIQALARKYDGIYFKALKKIFTYSFIGSFFLIGSSVYLHIVGRGYGSILFLILAVIFPLYAIRNYYVPFFTGKKQFKTLTFINTGINIFSLVIIMLVLFWKKDLYWIVLVSVLSETLLSVWFTLVYARKKLLNKKIDYDNIKFGKKTSFSEAFAATILKADSLIIAFFAGFEVLAIYSIATLLPNQIKNLFNTFKPLFLPKLSSSNNATRKSLTKHSFYLFLAAAVLTGVYALIAPFIFKIFYPAYAEYAFYSIIFSITLVLVIPMILLQSFYASKKWHKQINLVRYISLSVNVIVLLVLIQFGLAGAIIAKIIYRVVLFVTNIFFLRKI